MCAARAKTVHIASILSSIYQPLHWCQMDSDACQRVIFFQKNSLFDMHEKEIMRNGSNSQNKEKRQESNVKCFHILGWGE